MFPYYGNKSTIAHTYPKPMQDVVVEPFAGSAAYASLHSEREITLVDADPIIAGLWRWLVSADPAEILALPVVGPYEGLRQEAQSLIGFWLNHSSPKPKLTMGSWAKSGARPNSFWGPVARQLVANQVTKIRHWKVIQGSYADLPDIEGTYFVDPPYQGKPGRAYTYNHVDYEHLGAWCMSRRGQVIACEQEGATWLPFKPHTKISTHSSYAKKAKSSEVVWTA